MKKRKDGVVIFICVLCSFVMGLYADDNLFGSTILLTGFLSVYYASIGKSSHFIWGFINYILMGYVSLRNHLYGIFFFYTFIFAPLETKGFITWNENIDSDDNIIVKNFNLKKTLIILITCSVSSIFLGLLLSWIPGQRLAILDATSNILNLFGSIFLILQYRESWWLFLFNNVVDLVIWLMIGNSFIMILVSLIFLVLNIYGIVMWYRNSKKSLRFDSFNQKK